MRSPLQLFHLFSTFDPGGPEVRTAELIARLPEGEFEHRILAMDGRWGCRERVPAERVREWVDPPGGGGLAAALRLGRLLAARRPDLVLTYNWGAMEAVLGARLRRLPLLHHEDGFGPDEVKAQKNRRVWARRLLLRRARGVVVPSRGLARIARESWRLPQARIHHLVNGIDPGRFSPGERPVARRALGLPARGFLLGTVGGLRSEKHQARMIELLAGLGEEGDPRLVLAGDGPERGPLEDLASARGVAERVHFLGRLADPVPAYRALDLFLLTSDTEQMPLVVLEAMGCGLPVLATDVGDVAEMVAPSNRPFVTVPAALAGGLRSLREDRDLRERLGKANRERCLTKYTLENMVGAYRTLYREAARP